MKLSLLTEEKFKSATAIVVDGDKILLGTSTADDDRKGLLCFPAGGIEKGESPEQAAARECEEETGYIVEPTGKAFAISSKPGVAYVACRLIGGSAKRNHEFSELEWFSRKDVLYRTDLYPHNIEALKKL